MEKDERKKKQKRIIEEKVGIIKIKNNRQFDFFKSFLLYEVRGYTDVNVTLIVVSLCGDKCYLGMILAVNA